MSELMSQNEIDQLLKTAIGGNEDIETPKDEKTGSENNIPKGKHYKCKKDNDLRYTTSYQSPVIKRENYIFNPDLKQLIPENAIVVRTLKNYMQLHEKKQH